MGMCEICGDETSLSKTIIEEAEMNACEKCSSLGKKLLPKRPLVKIKAVKKEESLEVVIEDYAGLIRKAREQSKFTQRELALRLKEKESIIHKLETGQFMPSLELARKLENFLNIRLIERIELEKEFTSKKESAGPITIGDLFRLK